LWEQISVPLWESTILPLRPAFPMWRVVDFRLLQEDRVSTAPMTSGITYLNHHERNGLRHFGFWPTFRRSYRTSINCDVSN
jgi:hypothetical protein